ncbi:MFS general substrate transporter [Aulographum hederae CBS 113979]|uniref:MFS general substrate transporter n=1 Tax=Aulographum hederae CBS 113979 TaxID=1176131 RepID=A0A6G1GX11_9PEZI|nr:MFS general substrate transporter [Aulographum hederae CBS 113979]
MADQKDPTLTQIEKLATNTTNDSQSQDLTVVPSSVPIKSGEKDGGSSPGEARMTKAKWLAFVALALSYTTSSQQSNCTATILKLVDEELGPTTYYNWMLSTYTILLATTLPLSGGLSDIFGRRAFFLAGSLIALTGTIIALAAQSTNQMIVAMGIKGIGAGCQQLALAAVSELVPSKHRGYAQAGLDLLALPWTVFGALTGNAMVKYYTLSFRINFIIGVILNVLSFASAWFWYFPPAGVVVQGKSRWRQLAELDWIGVFLMAAGLVLFLVGIGLGGTQFAWDSAGAVAPIVIGVLLILTFGLWEWKVAKNPFMAHELFVGRGRTFGLLLPITFVGGMSFYSAAAFWTQQVYGMFSTDPIRVGVLTIPGGFGGAFGGFLGGALFGKHKMFSTRLMLLYGLCFKVIGDGIMTSVGPNDIPRALGAGFLAMVGVGWLTVALIVAVQLSCPDEHIGLVTLLTGSVRSIGGSVAIVAYTAIIQNTMRDDAGPRIARDVLPLGAPLRAIPTLVKDLIDGNIEGALAIPNITASVVRVAANTLRYSWGLAFKNVYTTSAAFGALAIVLALFTKDVAKNMNDNVAVRLQNEKKESSNDVKV